MKYKILDVINKASNETADKFGVIGKQATTSTISPDTRALFTFSEDGDYLLTSLVQEVAEDGNTVRFTTMNTIYVMQLVNEEEAAE